MTQHPSTSRQEGRRAGHKDDDSSHGNNAEMVEAHSCRTPSLPLLAQHRKLSHLTLMHAFLTQEPLQHRCLISCFEQTRHTQKQHQPIPVLHPHIRHKLSIVVTRHATKRCCAQLPCVDTMLVHTCTLHPRIASPMRMPNMRSIPRKKKPTVHRMLE